MIPVTKPFLPPISEYEEYLSGIWQRNWLTNNGPLVNDFELKLKEYLKVPHLLYVTNGTIALQIAIKALNLKGEVITTPFSYVATTSSIAWEGCKPVFVDIDPKSLNIDSTKIEGAVTEQTTAIIATHVYGNPCDIDAIEKIANKYDLKVIYDGAHCFGSLYKGKSVFAFGDVCTASFHATKLFHTIEGGAVFTDDPGLLKRMAYMRNFGHSSADDFAEVGINAKNSEFHAAMGLANFKYISDLLRMRKEQCSRYDYWMKAIDTPRIAIAEETQFNYAYYPLILKSEELTLKVMRELEGNWIYPRRYFSPGLNTVTLYKGATLPVSESIVNRVLCLPLYHSLTNEEIDFVCRIILRTCNN